MTVHTQTEAENVAAVLALAAGRHFGGAAAIEQLRRESGGASRQTWSFDAVVGGTRHELILRRDPPAFPLLVIGSNRDAKRMIELLQTQRSIFKPVAVLDSRGTSAKELAGIPVLGRLNKLEEVIKQYKITHLLQCDELEHSINLVSVCRQHGITYLLLPIVLGDTGGKEKSESIEGQPVIMV